MWSYRYCYWYKKYFFMPINMLLFRPVHNRLRGSIGFLSVQKSLMASGCLSPKELPKLTILWRLWPKFFAKLFSACVDKVKMAKKVKNVKTSLKGGSDEADLYRLCQRPPSWWNWTSETTNIVSLISVHKLLASKICVI